MARWNGPRNDLHGSALSPSQTIRPWVQSPLGKCTSWRFETPRAHTSPLGVTMMPCISPSCPLKVMPSGGDSGLPFGLNLVALPCQNESCACQPTVKLSPTQRLPSLSNIALPPARYPPPSNFSGSTHALGGKLRYGMYGTGRSFLPCGTG